MEKEKIKSGERTLKKTKGEGIRISMYLSAADTRRLTREAQQAGLPVQAFCKKALTEGTAVNLSQIRAQITGLQMAVEEMLLGLEVCVGLVQETSRQLACHLDDDPEMSDEERKAMIDRSNRLIRGCRENVRRTVTASRRGEISPDLLMINSVEKALADNSAGDAKSE